MSSYVSSISIKKILPVLLICLTVMLIGGAAPFVQDVVAQAPAPEAAAPEAPAAPAPLKVDTGDTAWILASSALVMAGLIEGDIFGTVNYDGLSRRAPFWRRQSANSPNPTKRERETTRGAAQSISTNVLATSS